MPAVLDGLWRPEEHPRDAGRWLIVRYTADLGKPLREVYREDDYAPSFDDEEEAQAVCDTMNPEKPKALPVLSASERGWLERVASAAEGIMERSTLPQLLALEVRGFVVGKAEPGRSKMDRWTVTPAGRAELDS